MTKRFPVEFSLSTGSCILSALLLLILPFKLVLAAFFAAAIHELFHLLALVACRIPILQINITTGGAIIQTPPIAPLQELLCTIAGPAGSLLCLLFSRSFPLLALCGLIQGLYNLIPLYPLDGGRILKCAAQICFPRCWQILLIGAELCSISAVILTCVFLFSRTVDVFFLFLGSYFLIKILVVRKIPCKDSELWVQ
jgi:Zn-dependent protease